MRAMLAGALAVAVLTAAPGAPVSAEDRGTTAISDVRQESGARSTRLIVECSGPVAYTYYSPDPLTLVVDIPEVDVSKVPGKIAVGTREVESIRITSLARADGRSIARLEVRLASLVPYQIFSKDKALNLVFERPGDLAQSGKPRELKLGPKPEPAAGAGNEPAPAAAPATADQPREPKAPAQAKPALVVASSAPRAPASKIVGITADQADGQLAITVKADGSLKYQDFFLGNPDRLVVDFKDVVNRASVKPVEVGQGPVKKVRLAQFSATAPKVARLVLDLSSRAPYHIAESPDGIRIAFGEGATPGPAPLAALRTDPEPAAAAPLPVLPVPVLPEPQGEVAKESFEARTVGEPEKKFTGDPINLDFKEGDILDIFRLFADISGLNMVVNPGVSGRVTLKLNQVPWDQALDLILKANNLGYTREDNVVRIAQLSVLQKEEVDRRKLKEDQDLAGDLITWRKSLSYAQADQLEPTVKKVALSSRGNITLDPRTNTMIIKDLPQNIEKAKELIADLDRATRQVEIEARVVVTSRNFTRELGVQWGFMNQRTPQFGNTTGLTFPNSMIINGSGVPVGTGVSPNFLGLSSNAGIGASGRGYAVSLPAAAANTALGISLGNILGNFNIDAALTALEHQGRARVLSTPKITTQNNQEAEIKQGLQIPIQILANNTITVMFKDAVLTLKVKPQITEAGTVILMLDVQNNEADFGKAVQGIPSISTQAAKTTLMVRDGATSVIGGVFKSIENHGQDSTPFLGKIPILGNLFRNRSTKTESAELLLFITPRITKG